MQLNVTRFIELQNLTSDVTMCKKLGISRTQLWRAKKGRGIGEKFISGFKKAYPNLSIDDYFF